MDYPGTNMVFVNIKGGKEESMGTSFVKPTNVCFVVVELVSRLASKAPL